MMYVDHASGVMTEIIQSLAEVAKVERPADLLGRRMTLIMVPTKVPAQKPAN
jgi:translation initiation factor IF-3